MIGELLQNLWANLRLGDVGGWLSGIGTLAAVWVALGQARWQKQNDQDRDDAQRTQRRQSAAAMIVEDVYTAGMKAFDGIELLRVTIGDDDGVLDAVFFHEAEELNGLRTVFPDLPPAAAACANRLLSKLQEANQLATVIGNGQLRDRERNTVVTYSGRRIVISVAKDIQILRPVLADIVFRASQLVTLLDPLIGTGDHTYNEHLTTCEIKLKARGVTNTADSGATAKAPSMLGA